MKFAQHNIGTVKLFGKEYWNVDIKDTPHFKFLTGEEGIYDDYLEKSWGYARKPKINSKKLRDDKKIKFSQLAELEEIKEPVLICKFRNEEFIIDGNHRAAIGAFKNIEVPTVEMSFGEYIKKITEIPDFFYGSKNRNIPYQSIFYRGEEIVVGRRRDTLERDAMIRKADIRGKSVVDIGCNLGASSILCAEKGAAEVCGYDIVPKIITAAIRVNILLGLPIWYDVADFGEHQNISGDTALAFSIDRHIDNDGILAENLSRFGIVYFETHQKGRIPDEVERIFKKEFIGKLGQRKIYRLTKI